MSILPTSDSVGNSNLSAVDPALSSSMQKEAVEKGEIAPEMSLVDTISSHAKSFFYFLGYTVPMGLYFAVKQVVLFPLSVTVCLIKQITRLFWQEEAVQEEIQSAGQIEAYEANELHDESYSDTVEDIEQDLNKQLKELNKALEHRNNGLENETALLEAQNKEYKILIVNLGRELINRIHKEKGLPPLS